MRTTHTWLGTQHAIHYDAEAANLHAEHCDSLATPASEQHSCESLWELRIATFAVGGNLVAYFLAVNRGERDFAVAENYDLAAV